MIELTTINQEIITLMMTNSNNNNIGDKDDKHPNVIIEIYL